MKRRSDNRYSLSPAEWLEHAESDLLLASLAAAHEQVKPELACFHAEQAAEKAIKALLIFNKLHFPLSHDLDVLIGVVRDNGVKVPGAVSQVGDLTPYAVETRYPFVGKKLSAAKVKAALSLARKVLDWVRKAIA
jgi:HEPN domain-containing protein